MKNRFQFSLRSLLVVFLCVAVFAVVGSSVHHRVARRDKLLRRARELPSSIVLLSNHDHQVDLASSPKHHVVEMVERYFRTIRSIHLGEGATDEDCLAISRLGTVDTVSLSSSKITDRGVKSILGLLNFKTFKVDCKDVSDEMNGVWRRGENGIPQETRH